MASVLLASIELNLGQLHLVLQGCTLGYASAFPIFGCGN